MGVAAAGWPGPVVVLPGLAARRAGVVPARWGLAAVAAARWAGVVPALQGLGAAPTARPPGVVLAPRGPEVARARRHAVAELPAGRPVAVPPSPRPSAVATPGQPAGTGPVQYRPHPPRSAAR